MKVCIGLPTRNEIENIGVMVERVRKVCPNYDLVVFDEHSDDGTLAVAERFKVPVVQRRFSGYGAGILSAIEYASKNKYDLLVVLDCDQTYPPEEIPRLIECFPECDFVTGARDLKQIYPRLHRLPNIFHTCLANLLFSSKLRDINSGMWAIKPEKFIGKLESLDMTFTVELYLRAVKNKYKIRHITVGYGRRIGDSKIKVKDGFKIMARIVSERFKP